MANTVNILGYANTFGDWIVATNADSNEINSIGKGNWTKDSGQFTLNGTGTSLLVGNNAIVQGQLSVQGTSSSAYVQNNLTVDGQIYFTNTSQTLLASGPIYANGTVYVGNTGTGLVVSNNTLLNGNLLVYGSSNVQNTLVVLKSANLQNTLTVAGDTTIGGNVGISGFTYTDSLQANTLIRANVSSIFGPSYANTLQANTSILTDSIQSNTSINTSVLSVTTTSYSDKVQANTSVLTGSIQANTSILTGSIQANASVLTGSIQANGSINSTSSSVTTTSYANIVQANTSILTGSIQANGSINSTSSSVTTTSYANIVQANTSVNTTTISATSNLYASYVNANNSVTTPSLTVTNINANNNNTGTAYFNQVYANNIYAAGNFVISGSTVYNATTLTLSAASPVSTTAEFAVYRGQGANAVIQWSNTTNYWSILDVNNSSALNQYSQIMTANMISDSTTSTSLTTVPTSRSLAGAFVQANAAFTQANNAGTFAQPAFIQANSAYGQANSAALYANGAFIQANAAFTQANIGASLVNSGGTINGALSVIGNLQVNGSASYINVATFQTVDSLIELAANNTSDTVDIGFYGQYVSTGTKFTGLVRTAASNYTLFQGITTNPTSNSIGAITFANYATLNANIAAGQITSTVAIPVTSGGTGVTTSTGSGSNVLSNSPTLVTPALGTPSSGTMTNVTGLPLSTGVTGTLPVGNGGTGVTTSTGSGSNVLSNSPTLVTPALGTPSSGNFSTGTFTWPTFNQNTTGTAAGLSATLSVASGGTGVTTSTGTGSVVLSNSPTLVTPALGTPSSGTMTNVTGLPLSTGVTGTLPVGNGGTGQTTGYKLFEATFTTSINATTDRTAGMYGSYGSAATNTPTTSGILYNFMSGTAGAGDGGQFWQDYVTNNFYLRQRWGGTYGSWLTILSSNNYNTYAPTLTGTGASGTWGISVTGSAATFSSTSQNSQFNSIGVGTAATTSAGEIVATGNITAAYSDDNLKTKLGSITNALEKVKTLNGFYYEANQTAQDLGYKVNREVGLSAQQVQKVMPEVVVPAPISDKYLTIHYERLIPLLVEAIKELEEQVQDLKSRLQ